MSSAGALYTPQVLALATSLARFALDDTFARRGNARSATCGSAIELGVDCDTAGMITRIGARAHACAIGQASAAIFLESAPGKNRWQIAEALSGIEGWLEGGALPDWPGLEQIAMARAYPARHGAMLLAWRAALVALDTEG